ncbi:MAG: DUF11 domain-containing protein [Burkholderiales bacterium]|nr:DUF11 domain-containing protein [Burkholderiales bacterium]
MAATAVIHEPSDNSVTHEVNIDESVRLVGYCKPGFWETRHRSEWFIVEGPPWHATSLGWGGHTEWLDWAEISHSMASRSKPGETLKFRFYCSGTSGKDNADRTFKVRELSGTVTQGDSTIAHDATTLYLNGSVGNGANAMSVRDEADKEITRFSADKSGKYAGYADLSNLSSGSSKKLLLWATVTAGGKNFWKKIKEITVTKGAPPAPPPPTPTWVSPSDNAWHGPGSENLKMTGNAVAGIEQIYVVQQRTDGSEWTNHYITEFSQGGDGNFTMPIYGSFTWGEGDYQVRFMVKRQGTWSAYSDWRTFKIDNTAPGIAWTSLSATARTITVKGRVTDASSGPSWVRVNYKRNTSTNWSDGGWSYVDADGNFSHSFTAYATAASPRTYDVRFFGVDKAGNDSEWSETRQATVQRSRPVVEWLAPAAQSSLAAQPTYRVKVTDPATSVSAAKLTLRYTHKDGHSDYDTYTMKKDADEPDVWYVKPRLSDFRDIKDGTTFTAEVVATNADDDDSVKAERTFNKAAVTYFGEFTLTPPPDLGGVEPGDVFDLSLRIKADGMPQGVRIDVPLPDGLEAAGAPSYDAANSTSDPSSSWRIPSNLRSYWNGKNDNNGLIGGQWNTTPHMDHEEVVVIKLPVKVSAGAAHGPRTTTATIWQYPGQSNTKTASATIQVGTDDTPPELAWVSPAADSVHGDSLPVVASATDDKSGIKEVVFDWRIDGGAWQTTPAIMNRGADHQYTYSLDIADVAAGKTIEARMKATDNAGNTSQWTTVRAFRKGHHFETFALSLPADGAHLRPGATVDLTLRVKADVTMRDVQFELPLPPGLTANGAPRMAAGTDEAGNDKPVAQRMNTAWNGKSNPLLTHPSQLPEMAAGNVVILSIPVKVNADAEPGTIAVTAKGWRGGDARLNEQSSRAAITVVQRIGDLVTEAALQRLRGQDVDQSGGFTPGDTLIYRLNLRASGTTGLTGLQLAYPLPDGLQANGKAAFANHSDVRAGLNPQWNGTAGKQQLLGPGVAVPAGKSLVIDIPVKLAAPRNAQLPVTSQVSVSAANTSGTHVLSDAFTWQSTDFDASAALRTSLTVLPGNALPRPGDSLTYEVTLHAQRWALSGAQLTFDLPAGLARDPARQPSFAPGGHIQAGLNAQWDGNGQLLSQDVALPAGKSIVVRVPVRVRMAAVPGQLVSRVAAGAVNVRGMQFAEHLLTLAGEPPETGQLRMVKRVDRDTARPGEALTYTIHFMNLGTEPLADLDIHQAVPPHTRLLEVACGKPMPTGLTCTPKAAGPDERSVRWEFDGQLPAGAGAEVTYTVQIKGQAQPISHR